MGEGSAKNTLTHPRIRWWYGYDGHGRDDGWWDDGRWLRRLWSSYDAIPSWWLWASYDAIPSWWLWASYVWWWLWSSYGRLWWWLRNAAWWFWASIQAVTQDHIQGRWF